MSNQGKMIWKYYYIIKIKKSLGYVIVYYIKGKLPWQQLNSISKEEKYSKIK